MPTNQAAVDIGTNSFHLLVAAVDDSGSFEVLTTEKENVRLGEAPGDIKELEPDAIERGVAALQRFAAIARSFDADIVAVATSAVREADNGADFVRRAAGEAGVHIDVISGMEEARLIHLGVLQALPVFDSQILVIDIGGGSTEMLIGRAGETLVARSVKLGHLRLTQRFFPGGVIADGAIDACRDYVRAYLVSAVTAVKPHGFETAVGSSGTATAIGELIRLRNHGETGNAGLDTVIDAQGLRTLIDDLAASPTPAERLEMVPGLSAKRADVIVAGAILLDELFLAYGIDRMLTSPYALREGVLLDRTDGVEGGVERLSNLRRDSLLRMVAAFDEDEDHVRHATTLALQLFDQLAPLHLMGGFERELLEAAGLLHNVGVFVSHASHHLHSYYIIRNSDRLTGYTEREVEIIAMVARYHRKSSPKSAHERFVALSVDDQVRVRWLASMLRIAIALDRTRAGLVQAVSVTTSDSAVHITATIAPGGDASVELFMAGNRSGLLAHTTSRTVSFS